MGPPCIADPYLRSIWILYDRNHGKKTNRHACFRAKFPVASARFPNYSHPRARQFLSKSHPWSTQNLLPPRSRFRRACESYIASMPPAVRRAQTPLCRHVEAPDQPSPHRSKDDVGSSFACGGDSPWVVSDMTDFLLSQCFIADICLFCSAFFFPSIVFILQ